MKQILLLGVFVLLSVSASLAQLPTGTILGIVKDSSGAAVPGATVTARNLDTNFSRTSTTEDDGSYRFPALPAGNYEIAVTHDGFNTETVTGLTLTVAQEAVINVTLRVGSATQSVEVTGEAPQIDTTTSTLGGLVNEQSMADLPLNGRNWNDLTLLQTGVASIGNQQNETKGEGGDVFMSNGAPERSNNFMLDGAIMQNFYGLNTASVANNSLGVDGIKEFKTITSLFGAEYGLRMGSQTTIVSKGGTNQFHGDVFEFMRNSALDARNVFNPTPAPKPQFRQNQFGGAFGGPIKKDKTFFFGVYEGFRNYNGVPVVAGVPAAGCHPAVGQTTITNAQCSQVAASAGTVTINPIILPFLANLPNPNTGNTQYTFPGLTITREDYGQMRVDQNLSTSDTLFVRYTIDDTQQTIPDTYPVIVDTQGGRNQYLTLSETHIISPSIVNTFRTSFSRTGTLTNSTATYPNNQVLVTGAPPGQINISGVITAPSGFGPSGADYTQQNVLTWSDDIFWTKGKHALKLGTLINHFEQGNTYNSRTAGTVVFSTMANFFKALTSNIVYGTPGSNVNRDYHFWTLGVYLQDDYRVLPRLTLNLGLRYEPSTTPEELNGRQFAFRNFATDKATTQGPVMENSSLKNWSPRIGLAWDVFGDGKTSVRSGFGIYYDVESFGNAIQNDIVSTPPLTSQGGGTTPNTPLVLPLDVGFPVLANFQNSRIQGVNFYVKQPYLMAYNLGIERQLPGSIALSVSYVGSRGVHLWDVNFPNDNVPTSIMPNGDKFWDPCFNIPTPPAGTNCSGAGLSRVNPFWNLYTMGNTRGDSYYNSLQVGGTKRLTHGLQFQASYTYSKLIDTPQGQAVGGDLETSGDSDPFNPRTDKGVSEASATHQFTFNTVYRFPTVTSEKYASKLLNGWWVGSIVQLNSGFAMSPTISFEQSSAGGPAAASAFERPDIVTAANVAAVRAGTYTRDGILGGKNPNAVPFDSSKAVIGNGINNSPWFNVNMFIPGPPGLLGDAPRGVLHGPDFRNLNLNLVKDTKLPFLGEAGNLQFRAEFFNLFNHGNLVDPSPTTYTTGPSFTSEGVVNNSVAPSVSGTGGLILRTSGTNREIQFGLKVQF